GRRDGRRVQRSVAHDEQILTTALGHESEGVQHYPFDVAVAPRFHLRELRVEIIAAGLRQRRHRVRRRTTPARYAHVHASLERLVTEIPPPDPRDYERLYRRLEWQHSHLLAGSQCDGAKITGLQVIFRHDVAARTDQIIDRVLHRHAIDPARVEEPAHMVLQPEDRGAVGRIVTTDPLENRGAVMDHMAHDVDRRILPVDERPVPPDFVRAHDLN